MLRPTADAARQMQVMGDRLTQLRQAAGRRQCQRSHRGTAQLAGDNALPQRPWKRVQRRYPQLERLQHALRLQRIGRHCRQRWRSGDRARRHVWQLWRDIGARLPAALQETFGNKLRVGAFHRSARHAQIARQPAH